MTRKEYQAFATIVKDLNEFRFDTAMVLVAAKMATVFAADNERFDAHRFYNACGVDGELAVRLLRIEEGEGATAHLPVFPPVR